MKRILFLLISTLFITIVYSNREEESKLSNSMFHTKDLVKAFVSANYHYSILSMVLYHSDVAFLGISKLVHMLAEDKNELADRCMNYMSIRNTNSSFIFPLTVEEDMDILDYSMTAETAMHIIFEKEKRLAKKITDALKSIDMHAQHFLQHTVMEAQYDRLSRIKNLYNKIKKDGENPVYSYEFDRSVNFFFHHLYTHPADVSFQL